MAANNITRRSLIGGAAATVGMTILPSRGLAAARKLAASDRVNIAVIGAGGMGAQNMSKLTSQNIVALADAELKYTETVLTYARHAQIGRVHFSRVSGDISYNLTPPEPADVLGGVVDTRDIAGALERFNPPHAGYKALKAKLAEARAANNGGGPARIAAGPVLKLVPKTPMQDARVPQLRERLGVAGDTSDTTFDKAVAEAVKKFGKLDIVFANAGIAGNTPIGGTTLAAFETVIRTNITSVFFTVQAAAPHLNDGGSIILNGSVISVLGNPGYAAYAASKAGVRGMARVMASTRASTRG